MPFDLPKTKNEKNPRIKMKNSRSVYTYALFQYYPLTVLLGRSDRALYACMPLLSIAFLAPCLLLWLVGVRRYKSAGS